MLSTLLHARDKRRRGEDGFTLIELLVVVVILGILIAIAIPVYLNYKKSANDKAAQSDVRNSISVLEVCNSDGSYPVSMSSAGVFATTGTLCGTTGVLKLNLSSQTTVAYFTDAAVPTAYILEAKNAGGSGTNGKVYCYSSAAGGSVSGLSTTTAFVTAYQAACPTS